MASQTEYFLTVLKYFKGSISCNEANEVVVLRERPHKILHYSILQLNRKRHSQNMSKIMIQQSKYRFVVMLVLYVVGK